ncbi:MAG: 3-deoxy-D-manno-octulosonic acid transferase [Nitrospinales bacterium]
MFLFYEILSALLAPWLACGLAVYVLATGKKRRGLANSLGLTPRADRGDARFRKTLWLYALSVGEVRAAAPVLRQVRQQRPDIRIVVSTTTDAGYDAARKQLAFVENIFYQPLDLWPFTRMAVARINPDLFVLTETSFWPGLLYVLNRRGTPALLFQGRISKKSLRRYRRMAPFMARVLSSFQTLCMMTARGAEDVRALGVAPSRVRVIGSTRFDGLQTAPESRRKRLREQLGIADGCPVFVAGSTHEGEEAVVLDVFCRLRQRHETLTLVLAPRRMERVPEIVRMMEEKNIAFVKRSEQNGAGGGEPVVLLDTMGELSDVYAVADVVFIGRSLFAPGGGHSLMEPAAHGKPVLHGPFVEYNQDDADALGEIGAALTVRDGDEMAETLQALIDDPARRAALGRQAQTLIEANRGASQTMAELILQTLDGR